MESPPSKNDVTFLNMCRSASRGQGVEGQPPRGAASSAQQRGQDPAGHRWLQGSEDAGLGMRSEWQLVLLRAPTSRGVGTPNHLLTLNPYYGTSLGLKGGSVLGPQGPSQGSPAHTAHTAWALV